MSIDVNGLPFDIEQQFAAPGTVITASGAVGTEVDLKGKGFGKGTIVLAIGALVTDDETYQVDVEMAEDNDGSPGPYEKTESVQVTVANGQLFVPINNQGSAKRFRFVKLSAVVAGTAPSMTLAAYLSEDIIPNS